MNTENKISTIILLFKGTTLCQELNGLSTRFLNGGRCLPNKWLADKQVLKGFKNPYGRCQSFTTKLTSKLVQALKSSVNKWSLWAGNTQLNKCDQYSQVIFISVVNNDFQKASIKTMMTQQKQNCVTADVKFK